MISILAPSKTLDFSSELPEWLVASEPQFMQEASDIVEVLRRRDVAQLEKLYHVSSSIAKTNHERFVSWGKTRKPALWAYRGDVYKGMYADNLSYADAQWAEEHIRIMSGLYGVLTPSNEISPYRLEMKAKLQVGEAKDLYAVWAKKLAANIDHESNGIICNLSSEEYSKPVTRYATSRVVTPVFMDHKPNGAVGPVPIYSKMMRGVMARWIIDHRVDHPDQLVDFDRFEYIYDKSRSELNAPAFVREAMKPLVF